MLRGMQKSLKKLIKILKQLLSGLERKLKKLIEMLKIMVNLKRHVINLRSFRLGHRMIRMNSMEVSLKGWKKWVNFSAFIWSKKPNESTEINPLVSTVEHRWLKHTRDR